MSVQTRHKYTVDTQLRLQVAFCSILYRPAAFCGVVWDSVRFCIWTSPYQMFTTSYRFNCSEMKGSIATLSCLFIAVCFL